MGNILSCAMRVAGAIAAPHVLIASSRRKTLSGKQALVWFLLELCCSGWQRARQPAHVGLIMGRTYLRNSFMCSTQQIYGFADITEHMVSTADRCQSLFLASWKGLVVFYPYNVLVELLESIGLTHSGLYGKSVVFFSATLMLSTKVVTGTQLEVQLVETMGAPTGSFFLGFVEGQRRHRGRVGSANPTILRAKIEG